MSDEKSQSPRRKAVLKVWAAMIRRWGELSAEAIECRGDTLDEIEDFDALYLQSFWEERATFLLDLPAPIDVPAKTTRDVDAMWLTICRVHGFRPPDELLVGDVRKRLELAKRKLANDFETSVKYAVNVHNITSPIEQLFLIEWKYQRVEERHGLALEPQKPVVTDRGGFVIDFLIVATDRAPRASVAVELDGHEFHERTKEQARNDRQRERAIMRSGHPVLRFTGSEVFQNARGVVEEVIAALKVPDSPR